MKHSTQMPSGKLRVFNSANSEYTWFALYIYAPIIIDIFRRINELVFAGNVIWSKGFQVLVYVLFGIYFVLHAIKNKKLGLLVALGGGFLILLATSVLITPKIQSIASYVSLIFFSTCIWAFYVGFCARDRTKWVLELYKYSWISVAYVVLLFLTRQGSDSTYLSASMLLVIPMLIGLYSAVFLKQKYGFIVFAILFLEIISFGSRSILMAVVVSIIGVGFLKRKQIDARILALGILFILLAILGLFVFRDNLNELLQVLFPGSRTVDFLISGSFFEDDIRSLSMPYLLNIVWDEPFAVRGIAADRVYLGEVFSSIYSQVNPGGVVDGGNTGTYAHNFFLEIIFQFGLFLGIFIVVLFCIALLRGTYVVAKTKEDAAVVLLGSIVFPVLVIVMVSTSYLTTWQFWLLSGIIVSFLVNRVCDKARKANVSGC